MYLFCKECNYLISSIILSYLISYIILSYLIFLSYIILSYIIFYILFYILLEYMNYIHQTKNKNILKFFMEYNIKNENEKNVYVCVNF